MVKRERERELGWQHDFLGGPGVVEMCPGPRIGRVIRTTLFEHGVKRCERKRLSQGCTSSDAWEKEEIRRIDILKIRQTVNDINQPGKQGDLVADYIDGRPK